MLIDRSAQTSASIPHDPDPTIPSWLAILQEDLERQKPETRGDALAYTTRLAKSKTARDRQNALQNLLKKAKGAQHRLLLKIIACCIGTVTMSAGAQVLTARLGPVGLPAGMGLGAALTWFADGCGTRAQTNAKRKQLARAAQHTHKQLAHDCPPVNELGHAAQQASLNLIQQVEIEGIGRGLPVNGVIAVSLNSMEFVTNLWISSQLGLQGGLLVEAAISLLPIGVQWAASVTESETCDLPEVAADLHHQYDDYLWIWDNLSEEQVEEELYRIQQTDLKLRFLPHGDPTGEIKDLAMAQADLDIRHYSKKKERLIREAIHALRDLERQRDRAIAALPQQFSHNGVGFNDQQIEALRDRWVEKETKRLVEQHERDKELLQCDYATKIRQCEEAILTAQERYRTAEQRWYQTYGNQGLPQAG